MNAEDFLLRKRARSLMTKAIKEGKLIRGPCEVCGTTEDIHGHHDDYSKPLEVRWLCASHHGKEHYKAIAAAYAKQRQERASEAEEVFARIREDLLEWGWGLVEEMVISKLTKGTDGD
jgi:hypothetical protein